MALLCFLFSFFFIFFVISARLFRLICDGIGFRLFCCFFGVMQFYVREPVTFGKRRTALLFTFSRDVSYASFSFCIGIAAPVADSLASLGTVFAKGKLEKMEKEREIQMA